ncbi:MAG: hypothetical protein CM1200mP10_21560 [Candidatus Neomarinimicrobiota bacterium]|nr:MAG: hypothetical protein CM1200mP10_21560 [Candidatus Neomarinimicrobiota bacterium]
MTEPQRPGPTPLDGTLAVRDGDIMLLMETSGSPAQRMDQYLCSDGGN